MHRGPWYWQNRNESGIPAADLAYQAGIWLPVYHVQPTLLLSTFDPETRGFCLPSS